MTNLVSYCQADATATITMDDGKVNALSMTMFDELNAALDRAEAAGTAVAMGVFLLLSGDFRLGAAGPYRITANEVAIGLTMPRPGIEIGRQRLAPAHFSRALILADVYAPDEAAVAGFLDRVVPPGELGPAAQAAADQLAKLDLAAHAATKRRIRQPVVDAIRASLEEDARALAGTIGT